MAACRSIVLALAVLLMAFFAVSLSAADQWKLVGFTKYRDALFMDAGSISHISGEGLTVRVKIAPSRKSKYFAEIRKELKKAGKSDRGFKAAEIFTEVDCTGSRIRYLSIVYRKKSGGVIHWAQNPDAEWRRIERGSLWHALQKTACGAATEKNP